MNKTINDVMLTTDESGKGSFYLADENEQKLAEMSIRIRPHDVVIYHTEVERAGRGKGYGTLLLEAMTGYARKSGLKVIALCPFVYAQFKKNEKVYGDIWKKIK